MAGQDATGHIPYDPAAEVSKQVRQSFFTTLKNLHPDSEIQSKSAGKRRAESTERSTLQDEDEEEPYLDSYLLHSPLETLEATMEAWRTMEELVSEGRIRRIGVSSEFLELHSLSCLATSIRC